MRINAARRVIHSIFSNPVFVCLATPLIVCVTGEGVAITLRSGLRCLRSYASFALELPSKVISRFFSRIRVVYGWQIAEFFQMSVQVDAGGILCHSVY